METRRVIKSDNIKQFLVSERDAATFPICSVVSWVGNYQSKMWRPTIVDSIDSLVALIAQAPERN